MQFTITMIGALGLTMPLTGAPPFSPVARLATELDRPHLTISIQPGNCLERRLDNPVGCQSSLWLSQAETKPDLALFAKASANFVKGDRYQTDSEIQVTATSSGANLVATARVKTIVQAPNKFRAEITFLASKEAKKPVSTVVSDGKQVWMYRSDLNQYAVMPYTKFVDADDSYWIGMSSLWFLQMPKEVKTAIAQGALDDPAVQKEMGLSENNPVQGSTQTIDGRELYTYEYMDESGLTMRAAVDPTTAVLKQIGLTNKSDGFDIVISEQISQRVANPPTTPNSFKFAPPKGSKKVDTLAIGPL